MSILEVINSRNIPLPIQREVRKRCGFGCVVCGIPLYDYDHLLGWANVQRHVANEITLLRDKHHREKTSGLLPRKDVIEANAKPFNFREGVSKPYDLHYSGSVCEVIIGSNSFTTEDKGEGTAVIPLIIDGLGMLGFILSEGHLLLNMAIFNESNKLILQISNNQLLYSLSPWDIQFVGRKLIIREATKKILIELEFKVPNQIIIKRGRFLRNGIEFLVTPKFALITNNDTLLVGNKMINCVGGIVIGPGELAIPTMIRCEFVPRYFVDSKASLKWAREELKKHK